MGSIYVQVFVKTIFGTVGCFMIGNAMNSELLGIGCWALFVALAFFND